jgi:hypothetical protein
MQPGCQILGNSAVKCQAVKLSNAGQPSRQVPSAMLIKLPDVQLPSFQVPGNQNARYRATQLPNVRQPSCKCQRTKLLSARELSSKVPASEMSYARQPSCQVPINQAAKCQQPIYQVHGNQDMPSNKAPSARHLYSTYERQSTKLPNAGQAAKCRATMCNCCQVLDKEATNG